MLIDYLMEDGSNLYFCIVGMQWDNGSGRYGYVIVVFVRDYIDLIFDQFSGYYNWIVVEFVEFGGQFVVDFNREFVISIVDGIVVSVLDKVNYIIEQKNCQLMVIIIECYKLIRMMVRFILMCQLF